MCLLFAGAVTELHCSDDVVRNRITTQTAHTPTTQSKYSHRVDCIITYTRFVPHARTESSYHVVVVVVVAESCVIRCIIPISGSIKIVRAPSALLAQTNAYHHHKSRRVYEFTSHAAREQWRTLSLHSRFSCSPLPTHTLRTVNYAIVADKECAVAFTRQIPA